MKKIYLLLAVTFLSVAAFCFYQAYTGYSQERKQTKLFDSLVEIVEQTDSKEIPLTADKEIFPEYAKLYQKNKDMVGWIKIEGTEVNYPIMQTPETPDYYLNHNFNKEYSSFGVPYLQENCNIAKSDNLILYGHHIKNGKMFGALESFKAEDFYRKHKKIQFDTLTEYAGYEIFAVFKTSANGGFHYNTFVKAKNESDFLAYVNKCKELSFYDTGVTAEYGDTLLTLSTCEYSTDNGRLVIVARKIYE